MTDQSTLFRSQYPALAMLWRYKTAQVLFALFAFVEVCNYALLPAWLNTLKAIELTATADAAALKYKAEADLVSQQVKSQIEAARNAAQLAEATAREKQAQTQLLRQNVLNEIEVAKNAEARMLAEADKSVADSQKMMAEAQSAKEAARNAELKSSAEARAVALQVQIKRHEASIELETARNAARQQKSLADAAEAGVQTGMKGLAYAIYGWGLQRCPGNYLAKVEAKDQGRC